MDPGPLMGHVDDAENQADQPQKKGKVDPPNFLVTGQEGGGFAPDFLDLVGCVPTPNIFYFHKKSLSSWTWKKMGQISPPITRALCLRAAVWIRRFSFVQPPDRFLFRRVNPS